MTSPFYDDFTKTNILTSDMFDPVTYSGVNTGYIPANWTRTIGFTGMAKGMTDNASYTFNFMPGYNENIFGSIGGNIDSPVRRPVKTFAINEKFLSQTSSPSNAPMYVKTYYTLKYDKASGTPTCNITGFGGIKFDGLYIIKSADQKVLYEEITVKPIFYSNGLLLNKLSGGSLILSSTATSQIFPLSLLTADPLFDPTNVTRIEFKFTIGRNIVSNDITNMYYAFSVDQITLI